MLMTYIKKIPIFCLFLLLSCADLTKVSTDPLAKDQRFYRLRVDKPMLIYHRKCNKRGKKCIETEYSLFDDWNYFSPMFMLAPYNILK